MTLDAFKFLFLVVQAAWYTVHTEFVSCHTNGTARRGARAFCVACRRRMCYADTCCQFGGETTWDRCPWLGGEQDAFPLPLITVLGENLVCLRRDINIVMRGEGEQQKKRCVAKKQRECKAVFVIIRSV